MDNHPIAKRNFAWLAFGLVIVPLVTWEGTSDSALLPQYLAWCVALGLALGMVGWELHASKAAATKIGIPKFLLPLMMFLGIATLSCMWARNSWEAAFIWSKFALCAIWVAVLLRLRPTGVQLLHTIPRLLLILCAIALTYGCYQLIAAGIAVGGLSHQVTYQVQSFFAHRNLFAEAIVLVFPFVFWLAVKDRGLWRTLARATVFVAAMLLLLLQVRSTWLALGLQALVGALTLAFTMWKTFAPVALLRRVAVPILTILLALAIGLGIYRVTRQSSSLLAGGISISQSHYGSAQERLLLWEKTWALMQERPIAGFGLGTWRVQAASHGYAGMRMDMQLGKGMFVRAHNDFLQLFAETGLFGGLAWVIGFLSAILAAIKVMRRHHDAAQRQFAIALTMSLVGYIIISCFSFPMERISHLLLLGTDLALIGILSADIPGQKWEIRTTRSLQWGLTLAAAMLVIACGYLGWKQVNADRHLLAALQQRSRGNWQGMLAKLEAGASPFCKLDPTAAPYAWYVGSAKFQLGDATGALIAFQAAYDANPYHLHVLNNLGAAWAQNGQLDSGIVYCQKAIALSPLFSEATSNLAILLINQNKITEAEQAVLQLPDSVATPMIAQLAPAMVTMTVVGLLPKIDESVLRNKLRAISNVQDWATMVYYKAKTKKRSLQDQLILEAIYSLENQEKALTLTEARSMRIKYVPN
jgi:O-antigen ligase